MTPNDFTEVRHKPQTEKQEISEKIEHLLCVLPEEQNNLWYSISSVTNWDAGVGYYEGNYLNKEMQANFR